ncbi:unnamed protein product [Brachionus calyciflorus]|uniref:BRO1 domain-containing protein n=1 Tax=Brachionus calyciflorus TaxID=104777 RepID=A0A813R8I0_9BILA|nr:unnamed protein product [Brachionus calyciflorus]
MASLSPNYRMAIVPQKKTYEINMAYPLQQFIKQTYTSNLDDYLRSAESLNQLRTEALLKSNRQEKLSKLMRYYDQMTAIESKLPISENQIRISFKWQDAFDKGSLFGRSSLTLSSSIYERLCVLFNVGACCSEIASLQQFDTDEGLKTATKLYQQAAGCFSFIRDNSLTSTRNDCTSDLYPETLSLLIQLMLAQAQEVFYLKSVKDKMRDLIISKLAAQCSDHYAEAMKSIQTDSLKDLQKVWLPVLAGKQALYHALSEYHKAEHESSERNIGECLARLTKAAELIKTADQRGGKEINLKSHINIIHSSYEKAKKENEYVYHERVPDYASLRPIERAGLAKIIPMKFPISDEFRDLFGTLVPMSVHNGLQLFKAKKVEAFNLEIGKLRQATELLNAALTTWNLPAAIEDIGTSNKIPQSLLDKSQLIKDKGGISRIDSMMAELPNSLRRNTEILTETKRLLEEEERSDTELRNQMKEKWTRTSSRQLTEYLHSEIRQYEGIIDSAIKANKVIEGKYGKNRDGIQLLSKSPNEIISSLPAATPVGALQNTHIIRDLRRLMNEVDALKNVREVLESEMKCVESDALTAKLVSALSHSNGLDEHTIIQTELDELVAPMRKQVRENIQEQEKLLGFIEKANNEFNREKVHNETSKMREEMMRNLATASDSFNELYNHLEEGIKFYNDLTPILVKFQSKVSDFVFARKTEKEDLMKEIQTSLSRPSPSDKPIRPPPPVISSPNSNTTSSSAPTPPYPTNNFTNPYLPMMPNAYNPYTAYPPAHGGQPPAAPNYYPQQGYPNYPPQYPK